MAGKSHMNHIHDNSPRRHKFAATIACTILLLAASSAKSAEDGGYAGAPVQLGIGARAVAMGGAYVAIADGPTAYWWNPAGVAQVRVNGLEAAWRTMSFDRQTGYVAFVHPFGKEDAAMSLGWIYSGVSNVYEMGTDGQQGAQLSNATNAATFTFARKFTPEFSLGVTLRYVQQNIANINAYTVGFDFGTHIRFIRDWELGSFKIPMSKVRLGAALQCVGQKYPWTTGKYWVNNGQSGSAVNEKFPIIGRFGIATSWLNEKLLVAFDGEINQKQSSRIHVGAEGKPLKFVSLRAGVDNKNLTLGAGLEPKLRPKLTLALDYAYTIQPDKIDAEHLFSLGIRF